MKIQIEMDQLRHLLNLQKSIVVQKLLSSTTYYNKESTEGHLKSLPIDKDKFEEQGLSAGYPPDFEVLTKYLKP